MTPACRSASVTGVRAGVAFSRQDWLAEEVPVALEYNGISHAVMLASPVDLEDFAYGFSLSEGIVENVAEIYGVDTVASQEGITVQIEISARAFMQLKTRRRSLTGRTGCGLCGTESLAQAIRPVSLSESERRTADTHAFSAARIAAGLATLHWRQPLKQATGATHAAAWMRGNGTLALVSEDVGRHNALDKLIGGIARRGMKKSDGCVLVTSRASYEMVQKTAAAGIAVLVAISAPTALAVDLAQEAGLTLAGCARDGNLSVFSCPHRILMESA
jgi:FdhD protein